MQKLSSSSRGRDGKSVLFVLLWILSSGLKMGAGLVRFVLQSSLSATDCRMSYSVKYVCPPGTALIDRCNI
jgi:hypothetical protein